MGIHTHLARQEGVFRWGLCALKRRLRDGCGLGGGEAAAAPAAADTGLDVARVCDVVGRAVKVGKHFETVLPALAKLLSQASSFSSSSSSAAPAANANANEGFKKQLHAALRQLVSDTRVAFGEYQLLRGGGMCDYAEAIASFMAAEPPAVARAIFAALQAQDWQVALSLAARHASALAAQGRAELAPKKIAADIVSDLMVQLEQAATFIDGSGTDVDAGASAEAGARAAENALLGDQITQAAQLCVEYAQDAEGAVRLLLLARRFQQAAQMALRHNRMDLLLDDVSAEVTGM
jgi:hypothetical protein